MMLLRLLRRAVYDCWARRVACWWNRAVVEGRIYVVGVGLDIYYTLTSYKPIYILI